MKSIATGSLLGAALLVGGCGGGSSNSPVAPPAPAPAPTPPPPPPAPPPPPTLDPQYRASAPTPFVAGCDQVAAVGQLYVNAEVEPSLVINPANTRNFIASWQEDRWASGGARGIVVGSSSDGGVTWTQNALPFTRCGGGTPANGGDYERASNAWMSISTGGIAFVATLAFDGAVLQPGSVSAVLASRSTDDGVTFGPVSTLIRDGATAFNDKVAITADLVTPHFVYAVWDRLTANTGPTMFTRSEDDGQHWDVARPIYDPGINNQTISNAIVVLPNGTLVNLFVDITGGANDSFTSALAVIRSSDNGASWSTPIKVADNLSVGTRDPDTGAAVRDSSLVPAIEVGPGGVLYVLWQDARFSAGARDAIVLSRSTDGVLTPRVCANARQHRCRRCRVLAHGHGEGRRGSRRDLLRFSTKHAGSLDLVHRPLACSLGRCSDMAGDPGGRPVRSGSRAAVYDERRGSFPRRLPVATERGYDLHADVRSDRCGRCEQSNRCFRCAGGVRADDVFEHRGREGAHRLECRGDAGVRRIAAVAGARQRQHRADAEGPSASLNAALRRYGWIAHSSRSVRARRVTGSGGTHNEFADVAA